MNCIKRFCQGNEKYLGIVLEAGSYDNLIRRVIEAATEMADTKLNQWYMFLLNRLGYNDITIQSLQ